eukprot:GHRR01027553.1.p1 GENE.GHRR01027553.1~~GHRR01027553.1.p1  ORF type:complete len:189 (+),score=38.75 GHRR01027553.1:240-806(+)
MDARTALAGTARLPPCRTWVTPPHTCVRARTICLPQPCKHAVAQVATVQTPTQASTTEDGQQHRMKQELLTWLAGTERGSNAAKQLRGQIEEAQVAVEALCPPELDYSLLEGKWLLRHTTAADVVSAGYPTVALAVRVSCSAGAGQTTTSPSKQLQQSSKRRARCSHLKLAPAAAPAYACSTLMISSC